MLNDINCTVCGNHIIAAILHTLEVWFVSSIQVQVLYWKVIKIKIKKNNNNNNFHHFWYLIFSKLHDICHELCFLENINPEHNHITFKQCDQYCHVTLLTFYEFPSVTSLVSHVVFVHNSKEVRPSREVGSTSVRQETSRRFGTRAFIFLFVVACQFCTLSHMNGVTAPPAVVWTPTLTLILCVHLHFTYNIMWSPSCFP